MREHLELPADFYRGIDLFNACEFYDCHEVLEDVWRDQVDPERQLTQGIIQIAVAMYHARRNNFVGAGKLMERGVARVERSLGIPVNLDVSLLLADALEAKRVIAAGIAPEPFSIHIRRDQAD